jgi:hypothetical protein
MLSRGGLGTNKLNQTWLCIKALVDQSDDEFFRKEMADNHQERDEALMQALIINQEIMLQMHRVNRILLEEMKLNRRENNG